MVSLRTPGGVQSGLYAFYLPELLSYLAHNKVCALFSVTGSWFLERDITVEFFKCICWEHHLVPLYLQIDKQHYMQEEKYVF